MCAARPPPQLPVEWRDGQLFVQGRSADEWIEHAQQRELAEKNLWAFARQAWTQIEGARPFVPGWYLEAIAEHIQAVLDGQIANLLINVVPRSWKSGTLGICAPAWHWQRAPETRFLYFSGVESLAVRDSIKCRALMQSAWYQNRYGSKFKLSEDFARKDYFGNDKGGYRICVGSKSRSTGEGGDILCGDDPNDAGDMYSEADLESVLNFWGSVLPTRINDPARVRRIVMQQRICENDLSGHILSRDRHGWVHLMLPLEFEPLRRCFTIKLPGHDKIWSDPRTKEGESLCPARWTPGAIRQLKKDLKSEYEIAGQLQQRPAPLEGGLIKKKWFKWWKDDKPPKLEYVLQSWDTATSQREHAAYSACSTWGLFQGGYNTMNMVLLSMWRGRHEYPDLRKMIQRMAVNYLDDDIDNPIGIGSGKCKADVVLIEEKSSGMALVPDLRRAGVPGVFGFNPDKYGDKIGRVRRVSALIEDGRVWLPAQKNEAGEFNFLKPWADEFLTNCAMFPNGASRDLVDSMTQALLRLNESGWLLHSDDPKQEPTLDDMLRQGGLQGAPY